MQHRIREVLRERKVTQAALAERIGTHTVHLNRLLSGRVPLTPDWLGKIARALELEDPRELLINARTATVGAVVQAGEWSTAGGFRADAAYEVSVPRDEHLSQWKLYAAEVRGPSMNLVYPEGTIIVFTDAKETGEDLELGKHYVIERERADGMREWTVKKLARDETGRFWLVPESDDPRYQVPIPVSGAEGETVRIIGRVRRALRPE